MNVYEIIIMETTMIPLGGETGVVYQPQIKMVWEGKITAKNQSDAIAAAGGAFGKFDPQIHTVKTREFK